jgi:aryl-alcohol dehydrogenase-like predicted oxidoreductase
MNTVTPINEQKRQLGKSDIFVTPVAMGCWPIAGMTSVDVNEADSLATLRAAFENGVNFFDTAYCYGAAGESERLIAKALGHEREKIVIATKCGIHWDSQLQRHVDGRPETLKRECEESLQRLNVDHVDLLYLHAPDPNTPVEESAFALHGLMKAGKTKLIGVSNFTVDQLARFHSVCPISAVQPPYNMLQRQIEADVIPWCRQNDVSIVIYWPLMKGLLAGQISRQHQFAKNDGRAKYPMFQGDEFQRNQDFLERLRSTAKECGKTVSQLVVNWTMNRPGITAALCGAKRAYQIEENAGAMGWTLAPQTLSEIDHALDARGQAIVKSAV